MTRQVSAIFYDLDGTLVDSCSGIESALKRAADEICPEIQIPALRTYIGPPITKIIENVFGPLPERTITRLKTRFRSIYDNETCTECTLFPEVSETLERLKAQGIRQFIVTNKPQKPTAKILNLLGLHLIIEKTISPDSASPSFVGKSAAAKNLSRDIGIKSARCWFVGDSPDDFEAAHENGMSFLGVAYGYGSNLLNSDCKLLNRFGEISKALNLPISES